MASTKHTNRLIHETSPYLLQHAHNPVDWYPWGAEAFEAARRLNKPIFLSIGYSTCYWCHVMERECFENQQIAREMNQRFINIKVDREERPDVDQLYMTAVQVLSKHGGWPLNVFLAPDLRPFYGGTYLPPTDVYGRPGFLTVLRAIEDSYRRRSADVEQTCAQLLNILQQLAEPQPPESPLRISPAFVDELVDRSTADYDRQYGGFGAAPKFPRQTLLEMLLVYCSHRPAEGETEFAARQQHVLAMVRHTLDAMADGGIRDHLGGGFHRYSTDAQWLVPHFEITLYDNALLAWVYAEAHRQTGERHYAGVARGILDFILREMTSPQGAFYTAFDAEVDAREGQSYLWTADDVRRILGEDDSRLFARVYGLDRGANFCDPHRGTGQPDKNILYLSQPMAKLVPELGISENELEAKLAPMRQRLYEARRRRKQPLLDTKVITSWNALTIRALAHGGRVLDEPRYAAAAARAADFLLEHHRTPDSGLWRTSRDGMPRNRAFLDDYAHLTQALLDLAQSPQQEHRRNQASDIEARMVERFGDAAGGLYFSEASADDIIVRQKIGSDSPLPSGNAAAAMCLIDLDLPLLSQDVIAAFAGQLEQMADSMSAMIQAAIMYVRRTGPISVSPGPWRGRAQPPPTPEQIASGVITVDPHWASPRELRLKLKILDGFHINAHDVREGLEPTILTIAGNAGGLVQSIDYPPGEERRFSFAAAPVRMYSGSVCILVRFEADVQGREPISMSLRYQPCNRDACFPTVSKRFEVAPP